MGGINPVYECTRRQTDTRYSSQCVRIQAGLIDQAVSDRCLEILRPDQIEIALCAMKELERRSQAVDQQWRMRIERLEYQSQLAQRRYEEVDPSNRLEAGTLERRWNEALEQLQAARVELEQSRKEQGLELTEEQTAQLRALAEDLPRLWKSPTTSAQDRKRMLRLLIKDITAEKQRAERKAVLHLRWQGGAVEDVTIELPLAGGVYLRLSTDQVRFYRMDAAQRMAHAGGGYHPGHRNPDADPVPLEEISPLVFSEVMRDVDMFVGVASLGNGPGWNDGAADGRYCDYWHGYSVGDLNATARTRKEDLQRLLPRLTITKHCSFDEKFLIPSKAFLLAADTKIKNETITRPIRQN